MREKGAQKMKLVHRACKAPGTEGKRSREAREHIENEAR